MSDLCHCGSGDAYSECCGQYLNGADQYPSTPESVMRARYTAHVVGDIEFLKYSYAEEKREEINWDYLVKWIERSEFLGLEISNPQIGEDEAELELIAHYREQGKQRDLLHEISQFRKQDGRWVFFDAKAPTITTVRRDSPKIGRNDPCPCGSGKKFKKCHGAVV